MIRRHESEPRRVWAVRGAALAPLAVLGVLAAGCGGGTSSPGVASLGPATTSTSQNGAAGAQSQTPVGGNNTAALVAFANCMQKHGIQVQIEKSGQGINITGGGGPNSTQMQTAQKACQELLPGGGPKPLTPAEQAANNKALLQLATCMRSHGYPTFPDPTSQGVFNLTGSNGFDPNSPQFQSAMNTCRPTGATRLRIGMRVAVSGPGPAAAGDK